jgi:putative tricarboxylic transport membrane protein
VSATTGGVRDVSNLKDAMAGAIVAAAGGGLFLAALSFTSPSAQAEAVGPRFFPLVASAVLAVGGLGLVLTSLRAKDARATGADEETAPLRRLVVVVVMFAGFLVLFEPVGFLISTTLFMTVMTSYVRLDRWKSNAIVGILTSLVIYFSFTRLLGVGLPVGVLG